MTCYIDCTTDEKYLTLSLWGKPAFIYVLQKVVDSNCFNKIYIVSSHKYINYLVSELNLDVSIISELPQRGVILDGRAVNISIATIKRIIEQCREFDNFNILDYVYLDEEKVLVDSIMNFELSLVLIRKANKVHWLRKSVVKRINEKSHILNKADGDEICLIGHSQFDQWNVEQINGINIRNCGISGITINEYLSDILYKELLNYNSKIFIVLLGINDIALEKTVDKIFDDYKKLISYLEKNSSADVYILECLHTCGRLDRDNERVNELNKRILEVYDSRKIIRVFDMDDMFGNLDFKYTIDGLHLNDIGYLKLLRIIENFLR